MLKAGETMNEDLVKATEDVVAKVEKATELVKDAKEKAANQMKDAAQRAQDMAKNASDAVSKPIKDIVDDVRKATETGKNFAQDKMKAVAKEAHKVLEHTCDKSDPLQCISDVNLLRLALTLMLGLMLFWPKMVFGLFTSKPLDKEGAGLLDNFLAALGLSNVLKDESKEKPVSKPANDVQSNAGGNAQPK